MEIFTIQTSDFKISAFNVDLISEISSKKRKRKKEKKARTIAFSALFYFSTRKLHNL